MPVPGSPPPGRSVPDVREGTQDSVLPVEVSVSVGG